MKMKTKSLAEWPALLPEKLLTAYPAKVQQRQKQGVVKLMPPVPPPDEKTVRELNDLASTRPFSAFRKVRPHDTL